MSRNRMLAATAAILATLLLCVVSPASAEVFALQGPDGSYAGTRTVQPDRPGSSAWTPLGLAQASWLALNLDGERRGETVLMGNANVPKLTTGRADDEPRHPIVLPVTVRRAEPSTFRGVVPCATCCSPLLC